jgi:hypothetical protein
LLENCKLTLLTPVAVHVRFKVEQLLNVPEFGLVKFTVAADALIVNGFALCVVLQDEVKSVTRTFTALEEILGTTQLYV